MPTFHGHLSEDKTLAVLKHLGESCGIGKTSRLTGLHRETVMRDAKLAGDHAKALHPEWVACSPWHR